MKYPKIKFIKSSAQDLKTVLAFSKDAGYDDGRNLEWAIFKKYPELRQYFDKDSHKIKNKKALHNFIISTYKKESVTMDKMMDKHKVRWQKIENQYYSLVEDIFPDKEWPKGKYIAYGTIWTMYPRFLDNKTFQIPFKHKTPNYIPVIIAHEMLHFMFYEYLYENYPELEDEDFFCWHVSEIFNTIIQNSPEWLKHFKIKSLGYPEHGAIVKKISKKYYKNPHNDIKLLIDNIISEVKKTKLAEESN